MHLIYNAFLYGLHDIKSAGKETRRRNCGFHMKDDQDLPGSLGVDLG